MALKGRFKYYTQNISETETETITITVPDDIPEWNEDYEFRGQTIDKEVPVVTIEEHVIESCYLQIVSFSFHKRVFDIDSIQSKDEFIDLYIRIYESEESRRNDFNDFIREEHVLNHQIGLSENDDIRTVSYNLLKEKQGYEELIDA